MANDLRSTMEHVGERFNLGEYEIDAYLAVLEHGQLTASEIADYTEIPQPRVYDTVRSLSDRGLVELRESRPMKIVAVDPADAFGDIRSSLSEMVDELEARYTAPTRDTEAVSLVKSRPTILRHALGLGEYYVFRDEFLNLSAERDRSFVVNADSDMEVAERIRNLIRTVEVHAGQTEDGVDTDPDQALDLAEQDRPPEQAMDDFDAERGQRG